MIFDRIDLNGDGEIDYSEFLAAAINKESLLDEERLISAFKSFDQDGSGTISATEL